MAFVSEHRERYIMEDYGLTKKQIEDFLPSELEKHIDDIIQKRIDARGMVRTDLAPVESKVGEES